MRIVYNKVSKEVVQVIDNPGGSITAYPSDFSVIEGDADLIASIAITTGLDISQISGLNMSIEMQKVLKDRAFGNSIINEYLSENKSRDLTTQESVEQLQKFIHVKTLLEVGAIGAAVDELSSIVVDDIFTSVRKQYFIDKLNNYLSVL